MATEAERGGAPLNQTRQVTIDALCDHFANDAITIEDFESRIDIAHGATSTDELRALLRDLPSGDLPAVVDGAAHPTAVPQHPLAPRQHTTDQGYAVAIMGGSRRRGRWSPARVTYTFALWGGVELDFREALLPPGVTEVKVFATMGGVEVLVPPGLSVECHGMGIMGAFEHAGEYGPTPDVHAPILRISGIALMGGVEVTVRHVGETARDARRRRRDERRAKRRRLRGKMHDLTDEVRGFLE
jgi:hypothetical protein